VLAHWELQAILLEALVMTQQALAGLAVAVALELLQLHLHTAAAAADTLP
jgi:hypothetical protein